MIDTLLIHCMYVYEQLIDLNGVHKCMSLTFHSFHSSFLSPKLGGIVRPHDGKCHLESVMVDGVEVWEYALNTVFVRKPCVTRDAIGCLTCDKVT